MSDNEPPAAGRLNEEDLRAIIEGVAAKLQPAAREGEQQAKASGEGSGESEPRPPREDGANTSKLQLSSPPPIGCETKWEPFFFVICPRVCLLVRRAAS